MRSIAKCHKHWSPLSLFLLVLFGIPIAAQNNPPEKPIPEKQYEQLIYSIRGADLYRAHCAPCHGATGQGDGPVAPSLKTSASNLTLLAKRNRGTFPEESVRKFILGESVVASHGSREMPVWGPIFHQIEEDRDYGNVRIQNLIKYLESVQQK